MSNAYNLARRLENIFGSFGHLTDIDIVPNMTNAPKWMALMGNICEAAIMPVELLWFNGHAEQGINLLTWETASEINTRDFEIERSVDGEVFERLGHAKAEGTNSRYEFEDGRPKMGNNYYRLKINDWDGSFNYSNIVVLSKNGDERFKIYPNPVTDRLFLEGLASAEGGIVLNVFGQTVIALPKMNQAEIPVATLPQGIYFLKIGNETVKFVKN